MSQSLTFTDNRNGKQYELPLMDGAIAAKSLQRVKVDQVDQGVVSYDPGYQNTATTISHITYVDGQQGVLQYRGYSIEDLVGQTNYLEIAYLLILGELPNQAENESWRNRILEQVEIDPSIRRLIASFPVSAHPMGMLISALGALGTLYPESKRVLDPDVRQEQMYRILGQLPTIAAYCYAHTHGHEVPAADTTKGYIGNFLRMMHNFGLHEEEPNPVVQDAMNVLFILHADHEQNCSTAAMRAIGSSHADPYSSMAGATAALYGPLHGGANEAVLAMLATIKDTAEIPGFLERVINKEVLLMGFGHRVYRNTDPRATLIKDLAYKVFEVTGDNPLIDIAIELENAALSMEYFQERRLYPNVDFYSGIIYQALGIPAAYYTLLFALARSAGWLAHWAEQLDDPAQKIARPKQIYRGASKRAFVPLDQR